MRGRARRREALDKDVVVRVVEEGDGQPRSAGHRSAFTASREKVTHPSDGHDDLANAVAGLCVLLADPSFREPRVRSYSAHL
jgi:hypothetical protein